MIYLYDFHLCPKIQIQNGGGSESISTDFIIYFGVLNS